MVGCLPCGKPTSAHSHLAECYPPSKQLVAAGPDYKPLTQDLSKLVYFASNEPSQLGRIGQELESRVIKETKSSTGGYSKYRAALLISLYILKSLISECKQNLDLFSRSALRIIVLSLDVKVYQKGGPDLEVVSRAASCFIAFVTYTDGGLVGVDDAFTRDYITALTKLGRMAVGLEGAQTEKPNHEVSRIRMISLECLRGASGSDALFSSNKSFPRQIDIILPALLTKIFQSPLDEVRSESDKLQSDPSPFFSEFTARRHLNDRPPSLRTGEKASNPATILSTSLQSLKTFLAQCQLHQLTIVLNSVFAYLDSQKWGDAERCCWLFETLTTFTSLQFQYSIPTQLVGTLVDIPHSAPTFLSKQSTILATLARILDTLPFVGLSVTETLGKLLSIIVQRVHVDERDALLPSLVQCVASIGAHIYYPDQINDIIEEIVQRMTEISLEDKHRSEILRIFVHCILGVLKVVHAADDREPHSEPSSSFDKGKAPQIDTPLAVPSRTISRRHPVSIQVWQETLPLLCESSYAARSVYARSLILFMQREMKGDNGDEMVRFSNALHAAVYTLAMSACLTAGTGSASPDETPAASNPGSPLRSTNIRLPESNGETIKGVSFNIVEPTPSTTPTSNTNGNHTPTDKTRRTSRRVSLPLNRLNSSPPAPLASFDNVATPLDFAYIVQILQVLHATAPSVALLTGGPMLFALDAAAGVELVRRPGDGRSGAWVLERKRGIREAVGIAWRVIGKKWNVNVVKDLADRSLAALPEPFVIPTLYVPDDSEILPPPDEPLAFDQITTEGESSSATQPILDPQTLLSALVSSAQVQKATNKDASNLMKQLGRSWTPESALRDSFEQYSLPSDTSNALMSNSIPSYRSLSKSYGSPSRAIDVGDLREALVQRNGASGGASFASTVGTGGRSFVGEGLPRSGGIGGKKEDVREVLKDIFRDKKRTQVSGGGTESAVIA